MDSKKLELELEKIEFLSSLNRVSTRPKHPLEIKLDLDSKKLKIYLEFPRNYFEKTRVFLVLTRVNQVKSRVTTRVLWLPVVVSALSISQASSRNLRSLEANACETIARNSTILSHS